MTRLRDIATLSAAAVMGGAAALGAVADRNWIALAWIFNSACFFTAWRISKAMTRDALDAEDRAHELALRLIESDLEKTYGKLVTGQRWPMHTRN